MVEGKVDITIEEKSETTKEPKQISVAQIEAGDFFGEMSEQEPRSATCTAMSHVKALVLKSKILSLIEDQPALAKANFDKYAPAPHPRCLMSTNSFVAELIQWGETAKEQALFPIHSWAF